MTKKTMNYIKHSLWTMIQEIWASETCSFRRQKPTNMLPFLHPTLHGTQYSCYFASLGLCNYVSLETKSPNKEQYLFQEYDWICQLRFLNWNHHLIPLSSVSPVSMHLPPPTPTLLHLLTSFTSTFILYFYRHPWRILLDSSPQPQIVVEFWCT